MSCEILSSLAGRMVDDAVAAEMRLEGWRLEHGLQSPFGGDFGATGDVRDLLATCPLRSRRSTSTAGTSSSRTAAGSAAR